jgi:hypothetical protein
MLSCLLSSFIE